MILTLAQLDKLPDGYLSSWLIALGGIALVAQLVLNLFDRFRPKSSTRTELTQDPLNVREVKDLATRAELEAIKKDIDEDLGHLRESLSAADRKNHSEIVAIHNRINLVAENTSAMKGRLEEIANSLHQLVSRSMK